MQGRVSQRSVGATAIPVCPRCRSVDGVQSVAAVTVRSPAREARYGGSGLDNYVTLYVEGRPGPVTPRLVKDLRPPRPPRSARQELDRRLVILVNLSFLGLMLFLAGRGVRAVELVTVAALLGVAAFLYAGRLVLAVRGGAIHRTAAREAEAYSRARRRWETLQYCADCGGVFQPGWRGCLAPRQLRSYLWATDEVHDPGGERDGQRQAWDR